MEIVAAQSLRKRVLVVDDDADSVEMLSVYLDLGGHSVQAASSASEAIRSIAHFNPQVILLDLRMPDMNGFEAARRIRALSLPQRPLIVAATGCNSAGDRSACLDAGIDVHLPKPLEFAVLDRLLAASLPV